MIYSKLKGLDLGQQAVDGGEGAGSEGCSPLDHLVVSPQDLTPVGREFDPRGAAVNHLNVGPSTDGGLDVWSVRERALSSVGNFFVYTPKRRCDYYRRDYTPREKLSGPW